MDSIDTKLNLILEKLNLIEKKLNIKNLEIEKEVKIDIFNIDENIIKKYLYEKNIDADFNLIKIMYLNNTNNSIKLNNQKKIVYWLNNYWTNDDKYIKDILSRNIYNCYLKINKINNYDNNINEFYENQKYIMSITTDKYKELLLKKLKNHLINI